MDFASITQSDPLVAALRARIESDGPITFYEFMRAALYDRNHGYYATRTGAPTRGGDYVTSPEVHPVFGALVAKQIRELWDVMSRPNPFQVVEVGGGTGALARDILRSASARDAAFAATLRYHIVEPLPAIVRTQRNTLADASLPPDAATWLPELPSSISGCVLSNELVDAFPIHRVVREGDDLREVYVTSEDGRFTEILGPLSDQTLRSYFHDLGVQPGDGAYAEVNLDAARWMRDVASALDRGYVLTFDYGYEAAELYAPWRRDGTLLCFYRQSAGSNPYQRVGKQDMTSSVDFTTLRRAGERGGLTTIASTDQASFLTRLGLAEGLTALASAADQMEEYFARRRVVMDLIDPARLGRIRVMLQGKDVPHSMPRGFAEP